MSAYTEYQDYFAKTQPGHVQDWAGGQLEMGEEGIATYTNPLGKTLPLTSGSSLMDVYNQSPDIAQAWDTHYPGVFNQGVSNQGLAFDFPFDKYPSSSSSSGSSSYSGLPPQYQEQVLGGIIPKLLQSVQDMPEDIDQYTQDAMNAYGSTFKNMATQTMPSVLNDIFGRNMQESSIAGDVTSKAMSDITAGLQPQAYQTAMQAALLKSQMPGLLANIAGLGSYTQTSGSQSAKSSDPGKPYATALNFLSGMMA